MTSQIISEKNSHRSSQNACLGQKDRNKELYELGKSAFQARKDKSPDEIDLEKYKKDLTFKPNVATKTNLASLLHHIDKVIPDYDKVIFRMHEGRKQK